MNNGPHHNETHGGTTKISMAKNTAIQVTTCAKTKDPRVNNGLRHISQVEAVAIQGNLFRGATENHKERGSKIEQINVLLTVS